CDRVRARVPVLAVLGRLRVPAGDRARADVDGREREAVLAADDGEESEQVEDAIPDSDTVDGVLDCGRRPGGRLPGRRVQRGEMRPACASEDGEAAADVERLPVERQREDVIVRMRA